MADKSHLIQGEASVFYVGLINTELDEKRERKALINSTHIVSRNTSREEIACSSLKSPQSFERVQDGDNKRKTSPPKINTGRHKLMLSRPIRPSLIVTRNKTQQLSSQKSADSLASTLCRLSQPCSVYCDDVPRCHQMCITHSQGDIKTWACLP